MHSHKQHQSNWRIISKARALLISYKWAASQVCPER
jgi:hypothetical protein